ncbi:hypothetical protein APHAL10511_001422 [Amanita phalloides]|nr:hypothetical protein APHAL10511_001422 [Amanita phalloides]
MSSIRLLLAFLLVLSPCFVYEVLTTDLTAHDIASLMKRAYNESDGDWVRYLSARRDPYDSDPEYRQHHRPSRQGGPPPSNRRKSKTSKSGKAPPPSSSCPSHDIVTKLWDDKVSLIKYGTEKLVYTVPDCKIDGESLIIRVFGVETHPDAILRALELLRLIRVKQFVTWGREVIHSDGKVHKEVWYVVQKRMGNAAEFWGEKLNKKDIPSLKQEARRYYGKKYEIELPPEFENEDDRYVYWLGESGWHADIVGWFLPIPLPPDLPEAEKVSIYSTAKSKHHYKA